ncbi:hypothetical protein, partial [Mesorhizobium sp. M7A.F.Ca.CA.004.01.1.1]|uniref:hypothetical protein n=1 Tax=Mesorhizobium sp. M7A.F.Ca.CA.004.01.1.1 TaxID=2496689 RepID=UPI0019D3081E
MSVISCPPFPAIQALVCLGKRLAHPDPCGTSCEILAEPGGFPHGTHLVIVQARVWLSTCRSRQQPERPNDTPIRLVLCDKIRQHYCPKFLWQKSGTHTRPIHKKLGLSATENVVKSGKNVSFSR